MVGLGNGFADAPQYVSRNDLGTAVLLAEMAAAGVRRLVLASSMVIYGEGRYECPLHGTRRPGPRLVADLAAGRFEPRCPDCGARLLTGLVSEDAPADPPQRVRGDQAHAGEPRGVVGTCDGRDRRRAALPQRLRSADAGLTPPTPGSPRSSVRLWPVAQYRRSSRMVRNSAILFMSATWRGRTWRPCGGPPVR